MVRRTQPPASGKSPPGRTQETADVERWGALGDLALPPGNRLERLKGDREGQHSIRINDQFRVCFEWREGNAYGVEITDYH